MPLVNQADGVGDILVVAQVSQLLIGEMRRAVVFWVVNFFSSLVGVVLEASFGGRWGGEIPAQALSASLKI